MKNDKKILRIGTRASPLAQAQAHEVKNRLLAAHDHLSADRIEIIVLSTRGDRVLDRPLAEIGGKGLFTAEIEDALKSGDLDMAVHSLKDMPTVLPPGLTLACYLPREDVRDAFISEQYADLDSLPAGAVVGTASLRRQAQTLALRPDVTVVSFRGNVQSRLKKLAAGTVDATYLAMAGLNRLGMDDRRIHPLADDVFLPAVAQGAICIEMAEGHAMQALLAPLNHPETECVVRAERAMLQVLDGSCRTPIAGLAHLSDGILTLEGRLFLPDGQQSYHYQQQGTDPEILGISVGQTLKQQAGEDFFRRLHGGK